MVGMTVQQKVVWKDEMSVDLMVLWMVERKAAKMADRWVV